MLEDLFEGRAHQQLHQQAGIGLHGSEGLMHSSSSCFRGASFCAGRLGEDVAVVQTTFVRLANPAPARLSPGIDPLPASPFVGRQHELGEIERSLSAAQAGRGAFVLISGEAGIGKTRLADAAAEHAAAKGFRVLWGRSWESAGAAPFWPWVQILRACVRDLGDGALRENPPDVLEHVAELAAEIRQRVPVPDLPPRSTDSEEARFARFDALSTFLAHAARERPLLLILDDVHWADLTSLALLEFFAQGLPGLPVLVLASYRDPQAGETVLDSGMLARLVRLGRHFALPGLSEREVARFVEETSGARPLESFVAALHDATNGNPFFVVEVLRLLAAEPAEKQLEQAMAEAFPIPPSVRATIRKRIALLPDEARSVLAVGAVIGREFDLGVLERVGATRGAEILEILGLAVEAGILTRLRAAPRSYAFSHGLVRETLYDGIAPAERAALHGRVGEAIESVRAGRLDGHFAELAHHFGEAASAAGSVDRAIEYSRRAGARALAVLGYEDAIKHHERALRFLEDSGSADEARRCELLVTFGEALWYGGEIERATAVSREAAGIAERLDDPETLARAAIGVLSPHDNLTGPGAVTPEIITLLEKARASLPARQGALRARVTVRLAAALGFAGELERSRALADEAAAMARRVGDAAVIVDVLTWAYSTHGPDELEGRMAAAEELRRAGESIRDARSIEVSGVWRISHLLEVGRTDDARRELSFLEDRGQHLNTPYLRMVPSLIAATLALLEGRFEEAEGHHQTVIQEGLLSDSRVMIITILTLFLRREQGRIDEYAAVAEGMMTARVMRGNPGAGVLLAWVYAESGRVDEARRLLDDLAREGFRDIWRDLTWPFTMWLLAEIVTLLDDRDRAASLYDLLEPFAERCAVVATWWSSGAVARSLGNLAATLGRFDAAERHFESALAMNARMRARPLVAWTQHDHARMLLARGASGDAEKATTFLDHAIVAAREIGMVALERRAAQLRERLGRPIPSLPAIDLVAEGGRWTIRCQAPAFQLRDGKGLRYLAHLLRRPGEELHVADLVAAVEGRAGEPAAALGDTGEILDPRARAEYRERLAALEQEIEEATARNDAGAVEKLSAEIEFVKEELSAAYGLGGRARRGGDIAERIRKAVTNRIRDAISQIERHDPALAQHLKATIRTGKFCAYEPDLNP